MNDRELLIAVLQRVDLPEGTRKYFQVALERLERGIERLSTVDRRHLFARARKAGIVPEPPPKPKRAELHRGDDPYSSKRTKGTMFAEQLLSRPMPSPIRRAS